MTDAEALEAQLVENLIRAEIHPMEEAQGFRALLALEEPKYSIEQIAAKVGKSPVVCGFEIEVDRPCTRSGRSLLCRRNRRGPCAAAGEAARRPAGTGALGLLQGGLQRQQPEARAYSAARPQSAILD